MSLVKVLKEIQAVRPFAEEVVEENPRETLTGRRGRKAQSIETLKRLNKEYRNRFRETAAFVLVVGSKREEFVSLATEEVKCFTDNPDSFYADLAQRVPQSLYLGKEGLANIFDILGRHLEDKMLDLDVSGYPQLIFRQEYRRKINTAAEFLDLVKQAINDQVGGEVVGLQAIKNLTDVAINKKHAATFTPVLLPTGDEKFALTVAEALEKISTRVFIVVAGEAKISLSGDFHLVSEVNSDTVKKTFKNLKK